MNKAQLFEQLQHEIASCRLCPRLTAYREMIAHEKRRAYIDQTYWGKAVQNFGDAHAKLLIVGLAPAAHGANRTGRMFTGDRSGEWLYRALHKAGFANQPTFESASDGLKLANACITAVAHCAPPQNKPLPSEIEACRPYLERTLELLQPKVIVALGSVAWVAVMKQMKKNGLLSGSAPRFSHAAEAHFSDSLHILGSYHPSQQNTFTKKLTEPMFDHTFSRACELLKTEAAI
jgi:uracil-DNA glycosylase family 4